MLAEAGVAALVYTSPSHRPEKPRLARPGALVEGASSPRNGTDCAPASTGRSAASWAMSPLPARSPSTSAGSQGAPFEAFKVDGEPLDLVEGLPRDRESQQGRGRRRRTWQRHQARGRYRTARRCCSAYSLAPHAAVRPSRTPRRPFWQTPTPWVTLKRASGKDAARQAKFIEAQWAKALEAPDPMVEHNRCLGGRSRRTLLRGRRPYP